MAIIIYTFNACGTEESFFKTDHQRLESVLTCDRLHNQLVIAINDKQQKRHRERDCSRTRMASWRTIQVLISCHFLDCMTQSPCLLLSQWMTPLSFRCKCFSLSWQTLAASMTSSFSDRQTRTWQFSAGISSNHKSLL